jgi:hypothetical protein
MDNDVATPDGVDIDSDADMERDDDNGEDEEEEDEKEEEVVDAEEDEDNGKEPRTIGHTEMVNSSVHDVDTMVDEPTVLPEQGQEMREHTQWQTTSGICPTATIRGASATTTHSED